MKRNMDLLRMILMKLESIETPIPVEALELYVYPRAMIEDHVHIMEQANLIERTWLAHPDKKLLQMTWHGHEFLELARDQRRWIRAKDKVGTAGVTFDVFSKILSNLMEDDFSQVLARASHAV